MLAVAKNNYQGRKTYKRIYLASSFDDRTALAENVSIFQERSTEFFSKISCYQHRPVREGVTGHIDLIQIRFGYIHLLDFKPMAAKEKYAMAQLLVYAPALDARTEIWLRNFVCGWFDEKDYFEFRPADVVLKLKELDRAEMRKYIPQFR